MTDWIEHFRAAARGLAVAHVWRGHGSALFVELGALTPRHQAEADAGVVRALRRAPPVRIRGDLAAVARRTGDEGGEPGSDGGRAPAVLVPDDGGERGGGAGAPEGDAVVLTWPEEWAAWLGAPTPEALRLQRPLPDEELHKVARGERHDGV